MPKMRKETSEPVAEGVAGSRSNGGGLLKKKKDRERG